MNHAVRMCKVECIGHFADDAARLFHWQLSLAIEPAAQGFSGDERHHEPGLSRAVAGHGVQAARVQEGQNMRMRQPRDDLDFAEEALVRQLRRNLC